MKIAIAEARKGLGKTSPNPCVGAVVVLGDTVVGTGYHLRAGLPHAEVNALASAGEKSVGATLFVTLEPCNHSGRTPPCTEAILRNGIKRVVIGMADPNPHVVGRGASYLASRGIKVTPGVLAAECLALNRPFVKHSTTGIPWVIMKAGVSLDGRIARAAGGRTGYITSEQSRRHVHGLRNRVDAILIGIGTAVADDPSLTTRLPGRRGKDPIRIILDTNLRLPVTARMLTQQSAAATWVFCCPEPRHKERQALEAAGARVTPVGCDQDGRLHLHDVLHELGRAGITSLLVEGGGMVHGAFLRSGLVDELYYYLAPLFLGGEAVAVIDSLEARLFSGDVALSDVSTRRLGPDILVHGFVNQA